MEELPGMMRAQMNRHGGQCSSPEVGADPYGVSLGFVFPLLLSLRFVS